MDLCKYTEKLWNIYFFADQKEGVKEMLRLIDENVVIIGTGLHEYYYSRNEFIHAYLAEEKEREELRFEIESLNCREKFLDENTRLVHGRIHMWGISKNENVSVNMDTRFSIIYVKKGDIWKIVHIHQSLPNYDQREGEYYPKTLLEQVSEERARADRLEELAKKDQLTGLLNHQSFFDEGGSMFQDGKETYIMAIDLDDFKQVNDCHGHQEGDCVLQDIGRILQEEVGDNGVSGRIGGDEFAIALIVQEQNEAEETAKRILERVMANKKRYGSRFPGISIGISRLQKSERMRESFRRADEMLYQVKRNGKNNYCINKE